MHCWWVDCLSALLVDVLFECIVVVCLSVLLVDVLCECTVGGWTV